MPLFDDTSDKSKPPMIRLTKDGHMSFDDLRQDPMFQTQVIEPLNILIRQIENHVTRPIEPEDGYLILLPEVYKEVTKIFGIPVLHHPDITQPYIARDLDRANPTVF